MKCRIATLGIGSRSLRAQDRENLILHGKGGYWFLPGLPFLSFAVRAADGYEIVRATFQRLRPLSAGLADIKRLLHASGRPLDALCGLELRY
jgi:hypothetical protein